MLGKASKIGSGLFSKLKSGINDLTDHTLDYAAQKGWDQTLRSNVGINLPRSGPKHSQEYIINLSSVILPKSNPHPNPTHLIFITTFGKLILLSSYIDLFQRPHKGE